MDPPDAHAQARALFDTALLCELSGEHERARSYFEAAAPFEEQAAAKADGPRWRAVLRVSAVSLWLRAGRPDRACELTKQYASDLVGIAAEIATEAQQQALAVRHIPVEPPERERELVAALTTIETEQAAGTVRRIRIKSVR